MTREKLIFKGVSEIVGSEDLGLLILTDESCERQISIVCDKAMAVQIELRLKAIPIANIMLPEVLCRMMKVRSNSDIEILIDKLIDGQYQTFIHNIVTDRSFLIRASDAVLFSLIGNVPILIDAGLMRHQSVAYNPNSRGVSLPVNTISDEMLQAAFDKAIAEENYELASRLRDEKRLRSKKSSS